MAANARRWILAGTDFSPSAEVAVRRAGLVARERSSQLELFHAISRHETPVYRVAGWEADKHAIETEATVKLRKLATQAKAKHGVPVRTKLAFGSAADQVAARASSIGAELVVVGPHGHHALRNVFVGSTTQRLQRALDIPLLVAVKRPVRPYRRALVTTDFSRASEAAALAVATLFPHAELHFLHVSHTPLKTRRMTAGVGRSEMAAYSKRKASQAQGDLDEFIESIGLGNRAASRLVRQGDPATCIVQAAENLKTGLVTLGAKGKSLLAASILGSVSKEFLGRATHDALLVK
jgi:nucleotide-binding universal stress UspA family protein